MLRHSLLCAALLVTTLLGANGCRSCSSCHDYDPPVANCHCGHCPQCGYSGGCNTGCSSCGGGPGSCGCGGSGAYAQPEGTMNVPVESSTTEAPTQRAQPMQKSGGTR